MTALGNVAGTGISIGSGAIFSSTGFDVSISSLSQSGRVSIGDSYSLAANGASISITNLANGSNALTVGTAGGNVAGSGMTARALGSVGGNIALSSPGSVFLGSGTIFSGGAFSASSSSGTTAISGSLITASTNVVVSGATALSVTEGASLVASNNLTLAASGFSGLPTLTIGNVGSSTVSLRAGALSAGAPAAGVLLPTQISSTGSLVLTGAIVNIKDNNILLSNGADLNITANNGAITLGSNNVLQANGGNVQVLAKGTVTGANGNTFYARAVGASAVLSTGGGIEVGSGLTFGNLGLDFLKTPGTNPNAGALGAGVGFTGNAGGIIQANLTGGGIINLNSGPNPASTLTLTKGAQVFDAQGTGSSVSIDHGTFKTEALKPIALVTELELDAGHQPPITFKQSGSTTLVTVNRQQAALLMFNLPGETRSVIVPSSGLADKDHSGRIYAQPGTEFVYTDSRTLQLLRGEIFLSAKANILLKNSLAEITARDGALVAIKAENGRLYVRVCSETGTISMTSSGKNIVPTSGEEVLITDHHPTQSEIQPSDGLGRRRSRTVDCGINHITISDFSILTLIANNDALFSLKRTDHNRLINRLLKIAATIDLVLRSRGPYSSN